MLAVAVLAGVGEGHAAADGVPAGTNAHSRPAPQGRATRVSVGVFVIDVAEIDDAKRTFTADVFVLLRWNDPRLASPVAPRRSFPLTTLWHPAVLILNQRNLSRLLPEVAEVDPQGNVEYRQRFQGAYSIHLNLRSFPLDEQVLAVRMVSLGQAPAEVELVADERSGRSQGFSMLEWTIAEQKSHAEAVVTPDGRELAGFTCELTARRQALAYVYQFVIPLTFIVCMSWAAFWMSPEHLAPRQGIAVTSMLTVIAYRFVLTNQLPRVAYLTRFDYLLLGCTTLVFLVLVEVVVAHRLMTGGHPERARRLDLWARTVFPALFLILVFGASLL